jgi:hypothetical protein
MNRGLAWMSSLRQGFGLASDLTRRGKQSRLTSWSELGTGTNINLLQNSVAGVNETVRSVRWNDNDTACFYFAGLISDSDGDATFNRERDLDVRMFI